MLVQTQKVRLFTANILKEKVNPKSVILKVGNQEVRVGYSYILKTQTVETNCKIRGIEFKDE